MIKTISSSSAFVQVTGGFPSSGPYLQTPTVAGPPPAVGAVKFDSASQNLQVWDGFNWLNMYTSHAMVGLNSAAEDAIKWAQQKQKDEQELEELMQRSPALRDAYEKFQIVKTLATNENRQPA